MSSDAPCAAGLPAGIRLSDHISLGVIAGSVPPERVRQVLLETGKASEREQMHEVQSKATQSAPLNELSSDNRGQLLDVGLPAPVGLRCPTTTTRAGDQGWLRSYEVIIIAKSVALFGFVAAMFALTALVAFSDVDILRGTREVQPRVTPIQSDISNVSRSEPIAMPGSAADRSKAVVDTLTPEKQVVNDSASPAPQPSRPGELERFPIR